MSTVSQKMVVVALLFSIVLGAACSGTGDSSGTQVAPDRLTALQSERCESDGTASVVFTWRGVDGADAYRVQLSLDPDLGDYLEVPVPSGRLSYEWKGIRPGAVHYWRVIAAGPARETPSTVQGFEPRPCASAIAQAGINGQVPPGSPTPTLEPAPASPTARQPTALLASPTPAHTQQPSPPTAPTAAASLPSPTVPLPPSLPTPIPSPTPIQPPSDDDLSYEVYRYGVTSAAWFFVHFENLNPTWSVCGLVFRVDVLDTRLGIWLKGQEIEVGTLAPLEVVDWPRQSIVGGVTGVQDYRIVADWAWC